MHCNICYLEETLKKTSWCELPSQEAPHTSEGKIMKVALIYWAPLCSGQWAKYLRVFYLHSYNLGRVQLSLFYQSGHRGLQELDNMPRSHNGNVETDWNLSWVYTIFLISVTGQWCWVKRPKHASWLTLWPWGQIAYLWDDKARLNKFQRALLALKCSVFKITVCSLQERHLGHKAHIEQ